jgi:hypothetical protein
VEVIRFHDSRATFCTWARRVGRDDTWIRARTGHAPGSNMVDRYARMAVTLADLDYRPFPDPHRRHPGARQIGPRACSVAHAVGTLRGFGGCSGTRAISAQRCET